MPLSGDGGVGQSVEDIEECLDPISRTTPNTPGVFATLVHQGWVAIAFPFPIPIGSIQGCRCESLDLCAP